MIHLSMKNFIPLLFWTVIGGNILNTDNITHIAPYTDLGGYYSVIFFNNSKGELVGKNLSVSSIKVNNTPLLKFGKF
jgi:hypothetical protein